MADTSSKTANPSTIAGRTSPPTPISAEAADSSLQIPQKRVREPSLEPSTPLNDHLDDEDAPRSRKDSRAPAKKNRIHLEPTKEEDHTLSLGNSRNSSKSPQSPKSPSGISPPHGMKVRQISQGVEDMEIPEPVEDIVTDEKDVEEEEHTHTEADVDEETEHAAPHMEEVAATQLVSDTQETATEPPSSSLDLAETQLEPSDSVAALPLGVKRKLVNRTVSESATAHSAEPPKRLREDSDHDDNPREIKKASPPPEKRPKTPPPAPKTSGFMAYASTTSPFASVKGQNVFSSTPSSFASPSPSPFGGFSTSGSFASSSSLGSVNSTPTGTDAFKRSGFAAFSGSASPFASVTRAKSPTSSSSFKLGRNKSPPRRTGSATANVSVFSSYASGGAHGFGSAKHSKEDSGGGEGSSKGSAKSALASAESGGNVLNDAASTADSDEEGDEEQGKAVSFGDKLRAGKDDDDEEDVKVKLTEQEVSTGEEDEETTHQVRGKLYTLSDQNQWKERGTGLLKINVRRSDGGGARLIMRKEAVHNLLLNVQLFQGMRCFLAQDPRYIRFSVIENGTTLHYNLRVSNAKVAQELLHEINASIPA